MCKKAGDSKCLQLPTRGGAKLLDAMNAKSVSSRQDRLRTIYIDILRCHQSSLIIAQMPSKIDAWPNCSTRLPETITYAHSQLRAHPSIYNVTVYPPPKIRLSGYVSSLYLVQSIAIPLDVQRKSCLFLSEVPGLHVGVPCDTKFRG